MEIISIMQTKLERVSPTKALWFFPGAPSMPCERQTAAIRNQTVASMECDDTRSVAYRYLQNKSGENSADREFIMHSFLLMFTFYLFAFYLPAHRFSHSIYSIYNPVEKDEFFR